MSLAEEIAGLPLATLLDCRQHYERAVRWETSPIGQAICSHTLRLIHKELTRRMPPLPGECLFPANPAAQSRLVPCPAP